MRFAGARQQGLDESTLALVDDGYHHSDLPHRYKLAIALADVVIGAKPGDLPPGLRDALLEELSPAEVVELALTVAVAQGFSKAAIAWGPAPVLPVIELPTPAPSMHR